MKAKLETCEAEIERSKKNELNFLPLSSFSAEPYVFLNLFCFELLNCTLFLGLVPFTCGCFSKTKSIVLVSSVMYHEQWWQAP